MTAFTIYACDDSETVLGNIDLWLGLAGQTVVSCRTPAELMSVLDTTKPGLIIMDSHLPPTEGLIVYKNLKPRIEETITPVLFYSSYGDGQRVKGALEAGAVGWVFKGYNDEDRDLTEKVLHVRDVVLKRWDESANFREICAVAATAFEDKASLHRAFVLTCEGHPLADLAQRGGWSIGTADKYQGQMLAKMNQTLGYQDGQGEKLTSLSLFRMRTNALKPLQVN